MLNVAQQHMNGDSNAQHEYFMNAQKHDKNAQHFLATAQAHGLGLRNSKPKP